MLSIVIPVYNEHASLEELHGELVSLSQAQGYELQIVMIDDGSTDDSWQVIEQLAQKDSRVEGIRFRRNFGKAAALSAGFRMVRGDLVMTLDADLQDDPAEIPNFIAKLEEGYDLVSGWKKIRHDPWHKVLPSRIFNWMVSALTGVKLHDHNCGMKCYRVEVVREVDLYGERHRFVPVLADAVGFRVGELIIRHRPRKFGISKYGIERFIKGFLDLLTVKFLTGFGHRPQHLLGGLGLVSFLLGTFLLTYLAVLWVVSRMGGDPANYVHLHQGAAIYYALALFVVGSQFMSLGFLGELITSHSLGNGDHYAIIDTTVEMTPGTPNENTTGLSS